MSDKWDEMRRVKEEEFFNKQNQAAMERLRQRSSEVRKSPVSGEPMIQKTVMGVVIDVDPVSGGVWLDAGELEEIITKAQELKAEEQQSWLYNFFGQLTSKKKE